MHVELVLFPWIVLRAQGCAENQNASFVTYERPMAMPVIPRKFVYGSCYY